MSILVFLFTLQLSYSPESVISASSGFEKYNEIYIIQFEPEVWMYDLIYVKGKAEVPMVWDEYSGGFNPLSLNSDFDLGISYKGLEIGYLHNCRHPIISWGTQWLEMQYIDKSSDTFYIRFSNKE